MRYKWDYNDIRNSRDKLIELNKNNDEDMNELISLYNNMLKLANSKKYNHNLFDNTLTDQDINVLIDEFLSFYCDNNIEILNILLPTVTLIGNIKPSNEIITFIDDYSELRDGIISFFKKKTNKEMTIIAEKILNPDNHILNISYSKFDCSYPANTVIDYIQEKKYISMTRFNEITDYSNLVHEIFHYIFIKFDSYKNCSYSNYLLSEIEGVFADILFSDYFYECCKDSNEIDGNLLKNYYLSIFCSEINELVIRNGILDSLTTRNKLRLSKLNKYLNYFNIKGFKSEQDMIEYINVPQETNVMYSLSYLVALDLFYIYQKDPEEAFYLLKNIKYNSSEINTLSLLSRNNITFFNDDYANLKSYLNIKKKKKSIGDNYEI